MIDSHVKVVKGWLEEPHKLLSEVNSMILLKNYKTIVNPLVIGLNGSTFEFISGKESGTYKYISHTS